MLYRNTSTAPGLRRVWLLMLDENNKGCGAEVVTQFTQIWPRTRGPKGIGPVTCPLLNFGRFLNGVNEFAERGTRLGFTLITIPDFRASPTVPVTICQIKRIPTPGDVEPPERSEFCWMLVDRDISLGMICGPEKERDACSNPTTGPREPPNQDRTCAPECWIDRHEPR